MSEKSLKPFSKLETTKVNPPPLSMTLGLVLVTLSSMRPRDTLLAALIAGLFGVSLTAAAQTDPVDHGAHHPGGGAPTASSPAPAPAPTDPRGGIGMSGIMGAPPPPMLPPTASAQSGGGCGAMGCMGGSGTKPFYATLMDMPSLTPEARRIIEAEAGKRLGSGSEAITTGQTQLHHALSANDPTAMQRAISGVRLGVLQAESGAAALLAINEGQPPRQIALTWFKGQMSVPATVGMSMNEGPWGLSWYHLTTMVFLVAFMLGALLIHYARLRRIDGLVQRLTPGATPAPAPAGNPAPAGATAPGAAPAPTPAGVPKPAPAPPAAAAASSPKPVTAPPAAAASGAAPQPVPPSAPAVPVESAQKPGAADTTPPAKLSKPWSGALRVADTFYETPNVKTFRLRELGGGPIPFTFVPGQFLTFSAEVDGKRIRRSYTIASSPTQRDYVELTVKREDQGAESRYLHDNVAIGDHLEVSGPAGVFTFTGTEADSIVLISGGVGITPMMGITRYLTDRAFPGDIFFLYGASTPQNVIFREELEYLRKRHANLHVAITVDRADETPWTGAVGRISKEFIAHTVPEIARRRVHVCGPPAMMEAVKSALADLGVPKAKTKTESFGAAIGAVPAAHAAAAPAPAPSAPAVTSAPSDATLAPSPDVAAAPPSAPIALADAATPATPLAAAAAAPSAQAEVQFRKSSKTGPLAPDQPVLEAAEAIGVAIDFSCRVGICGICVVPLLNGSVTMEVEEGLRPEDKARGIILACQAKSAGNLVVDA